MKYDKDAYDQLKSDLAINKELLDEEIISQPHNFFHASEGSAIMESHRDKLEFELHVVTARLDRDIRDEAVTNNTKITEAQVKHEITLDQAFNRANTAYLNSCMEARRWEALKNAYRQRADMLRTLTQLVNANYFGEITGASDRKAARERFEEMRRG